jgi:hypothetical protein
MAAQLAVERRMGSTTGNIVTEASLRLASLIRDSRDFLSRLR